MHKNCVQREKQILFSYPAKAEQEELATRNKITKARKQNALQYILQFYNTSPRVCWSFVELQLVPESSSLILPSSTPLEKQTKLTGVTAWFSMVSGTCNSN